MFVDGNAETIYFAHDSTGKVTEMHRSLSSRIRIHFKDNKAQQIVFLSKPEHRYGPLNKFTEDEKVLKGFIWKPKDRPVSKESIINAPDNYPARPQKTKTPARSTVKKKSAKKGNVKQKPKAKPSGPQAPDIKTAKDSLQKQPAGAADSLKRLQDTAGKTQDTNKKAKDTTAKKQVVSH
jgi:hypothetical protein